MALAGGSAIVLMMAASPAIAQSDVQGAQKTSTEGADDRTLEPVVVTARKRDEVLGDVPIAVTAFTHDEMVRMGVRDFKDLALSNPNVKIVEWSGSGRVAATVAIRGNIQSSSVTSVDPSVGVYMDGHLISHTFGTAGLSVDVVSVQTLKGPQGTLFGRNTTGGALLVKTKDPSLNGFEGYLQAELGDVGTRSVGGAINAPLGDVAAVRLVYQYNLAGNYQSFTNGLKLGRKEDQVLRAKLRFEPTDSTIFDLFAEQVRTTGTQTVEIVTQPNRPTYSGASPNVPGSVNLVSDPRSGERQSVEVEFYGASLSQDVPTGQLRLLVSRRVFDVTGGTTLPPAIGFTFQNRPNIGSTAVEAQYNGQIWNDRIEVAAGAYYFEQNIEEDLRTFFYSGASLAQRLLRQGTRSKSAYFQSVLHATEKFDLTMGLRYTDDKKKGNLNFNGRQLAPVTLAAERVNYNVAVSYKLAPHSMLYASTSSGYRSGGTGVDPDTRNTAVPSVFAPEELKNYEVGLKSELLEGSLRLGAAAFYQDYRDYQYTAITGNPPIRVVQNADALIKGFEGDVTWQALAGLRLSASLGFVDAKVNDRARPENDEFLPNIPRWTWSVTAAQIIHVWDGRLILSGNYSWRDNFSTSLGTPVTPIDEVAVSNIDSVGLLNLSATYEHDNWSIAIFANNVVDEKFYNMSTVSLPSFNFATLGQSRIVGLRIRTDF